MEYYERNLKFQTVMLLARKMLIQGIISAKEYHKIDTIISAKYNVDSSSIYVIDSLINSLNDGNMSHT